MPSSPAVPMPRPARRAARAAQVLAALVLCGIGAEVLSGYAAGTLDPGAVAFQLVFFAALYGAPALLARDLVRRRGWGGRACWRCARPSVSPRRG